MPKCSESIPNFDPLGHKNSILSNESCTEHAFEKHSFYHDPKGPIANDPKGSNQTDLDAEIISIEYETKSKRPNQRLSPGTDNESDLDKKSTLPQKCQNQSTKSSPYELSNPDTHISANDQIPDRETDFKKVQCLLGRLY